jgi:hypothetical protein
VKVNVAAPPPPSLTVADEDGFTVRVDHGPGRTAVIDVAAAIVSSVNGRTGAVTGLALTADVVAAQAAAADDAAAKVAAHVVAADPHGDRAWASGQFLPRTGGTLSGALTATSFNTTSSVSSAFLKTTSDTQHAATIYQAATGTSPGSVALNVISDKLGDSTMWVTGHELARGTLKIAHLNPGPTATSDANASAISIDLQYNAMGGTASQGIYMTATQGPTTGNLITLRNTAPSTVEDFAVRGSGLVGIQIPTGNTPQGSLEVRQKDVNTIATVVQGVASSVVPIAQFKNSSGTATLEVGSSGAIVTRAVTFMTNSLQLGATSLDVGGSGGAVISMKNATTAPTTNPSGGVIMYAQGGYFKVRATDGTILDTTKQTVSGSRSSGAALTSLLTALAAMGLITNSTSA